MIKLESLNRYSAFGVHIGMSAFLVGMAAIVVFIYLYPELLAYVSGVHEIFLMLFLIDVVLGPLITLIIFNKQKKELRRDLAIIGLIQVVALVYGMSVIYGARPVFVVFNSDRFDVVYANELDASNMERANYDEFRSLPCCGPQFISARLPNDAVKAKEIVMSAVSGGADVQQMPEYYLPLGAMKQEIIDRARPLDSLKNYNKDNLENVNKLIDYFLSKSDKVGYVPLVGKVNKAVIVVDLGDADILKMSKLKPLNESFGADTIDLKKILKSTH
jgi:hypothetical protein